MGQRREEEEEGGGSRDGVSSEFGHKREREMGNERNGTLGKDVNSYGTPVAPDDMRERAT